VSSLGQEWRGKLPPGDEDYVARCVASWRASGLVSHIEVIAPPGGCVFGEAVAGLLYLLDEPPNLPFDGCDRTPCCGCGIQPVLTDDNGSQARAP
jgi:hypothetical protein